MLPPCVTCVINFSLNDVYYTVNYIQYPSTHEETLLPALLAPQFDCMCLINRMEMVRSSPPLVCSPAGSCGFEMTWLESAGRVAVYLGQVAEEHVTSCNR